MMSRRRPRVRRQGVLPIAMLLLAPFAACGDEDNQPSVEPVDAAAGASGGDSAAGGNDGSPDSVAVMASPGDAAFDHGSADAGPPAAMASDTVCGKPIYATATSIPAGGDSSIMYISTVCGLDGTFSRSSGIEVPGGGRLYVHEGTGSAFVHSFERNDLARLEIGKDGKIVVGAKLSLTKYGKVFANVNYFVSAEKSILFDGGSGRAIVWNPRAMTIEGDFALPVNAHPGFDDLNMWNFAELGGGRLMIPVWWVDWNNNRMWPKASALVVDTLGNKVDGLVEKDGCPGAVYLIKAPSARIFAADTWSLYFRWTDPAGKFPHSCAIRTPGTAADFEGEILDLQARTGGRATGNLALGDDGTAYTVAYYPEKGDVEKDLFERFNTSDAWRIWRFRLEASTMGEEVQGIPGVGGNVRFERFEGKLFALVEEGKSGTAFYELSAAGPARRSLVVPGSWLIEVGQAWK